MTYLLTDNPYIVAGVFGSVIIFYGLQAGGNPFVATLKALIGRSEVDSFKGLLRAQVVGVITAVLTYHLLIKFKIINKHPLDKIK